ncbi:MAG: hypothetical protein K2X86_11460, partial [Cytophagaceae bacterium]|nr:hypothetical protein [Cytophagaceae bacterium]
MQSGSPFIFLEKNKLRIKDILPLRFIPLCELVVVLLFTIFPLIFNLPFRDNLYLTWEGTYRLYLGQMPYKDFGMPLGYGYFIIPLIFFFIFGPALKTLLYAQVLINLLSVLVFRDLMKRLGLSEGQRFLSVLVFTFSYTFIFFWPWYNNTAFFYQLVGIYFIVRSIQSENVRSYIYIGLSGFFIFLSFFTKQDYGGLAIVFAGVLLIYQAMVEWEYKKILLFGAVLAVSAFAFIYPFLKYDFLYWFNYGQAPHQSRLDKGMFLNEILGGSPWEKFYLLIIGIIVISMIRDFKNFIKNKNEVLFLLITLGILMEALITKVTSRLPSDTTTYFHGFAFAYIISHLSLGDYHKRIPLLLASAALIFLWWSGMFWKYANRMFNLAAENENPNKKKEALVWEASTLPVFSSINLPEATEQGIARIKNLEVVNKNKNLRVLNMSELTPLANDLNYQPKRNLPLWYHFNIGMFQKEVDELSVQIKNKEYDLVLFEVVPSLDNFYPEQIRNKLKEHYRQ